MWRSFLILDWIWSMIWQETVTWKAMTTVLRTFCMTIIMKEKNLLYGKIRNRRLVVSSVKCLIR